MNSSLGGVTFITEEGKGITGYTLTGADTVFPFSSGNVSFHIKVTATAYFNDRLDRIDGYFYYDADCTIINGVLTQTNIVNNWYTYKPPYNSNPKITSIAISNFKVL